MQSVEIRIKGRLDKNWSEWFEGFEIGYPVGDETLLIGSVRDSSELYSLIARLRDLGLALISVDTTHHSVEEES